MNLDQGFKLKTFHGRLINPGRVPLGSLGPAFLYRWKMKLSLRVRIGTKVFWFLAPNPFNSPAESLALLSSEGLSG